VEVRTGAPKPDVSTVEAFKRALLNAKSIGYLRVCGVAQLVDRLGIADAIMSKVTILDTDAVSELVTNGELELGVVVITQILNDAGRRIGWSAPVPDPILYDVRGGHQGQLQSTGRRPRFDQIPRWSSGEAPVEHTGEPTTLAPGEREELR
jgi:hypothetical protein